MSNTGDTKEKAVGSEHAAKASLEMGRKKSEIMNESSSNRK